MATWSSAFAEQATSDLDAYNLLARSNLPSSHRLHYLQMWLEKLCKVYLWMPEAGIDELELRAKHNVIEKVLPKLIKVYWRHIGFGQRPDTSRIQEICREIDLLHPAIDDGTRRRDNVEYPWRGVSGQIEVPAKWSFPIAGRLYSHPGRLLLEAAVRLTRNPAVFVR